MYSLRQGWQALTHSHQMADSNAADQEKLLKTLEKRAAEAEQRLSALENGNFSSPKETGPLTRIRDFSTVLHTSDGRVSRDRSLS